MLTKVDQYFAIFFPVVYLFLLLFKKFSAAFSVCVEVTDLLLILSAVLLPIKSSLASAFLRIALFEVV